MAADWTDLTLAYTAYLALVSCLGRHAGARPVALTALAGALVLWQAWPAMPPAATDALVRAAWGLAPGLALLAAYGLSGAYFIGPMARLERALLEPDRRLLWNSGLLPAWGAAPPLLREAVELAYLLVYAMVPAGALTLLLGGRIDALPRFWAAVFLSELACYACLPWLRTRPPRVVEAGPSPAGIGPVRRLNLVVLRWGSIQVNTVPSAHAAGAVAVALAVHAAVPAAGPPFLALAAAIACATVLGRYHYLVDTVAGVIVGVIAWWVG